ncbi:MAG TPA: hypothetical protein VEI02_14985, partial [Planctomycetota bacterium]|nr:hypothetical protein [Planctomycetota bacterium]
MRGTAARRVGSTVFFALAIVGAADAQAFQVFERSPGSSASRLALTVVASPPPTFAAPGGWVELRVQVENHGREELKVALRTEERGGRMIARRVVAAPPESRVTTFLPINGSDGVDLFAEVPSGDSGSTSVRAEAALCHAFLDAAADPRARAAVETALEILRARGGAPAFAHVRRAPFGAFAKCDAASLPARWTELTGYDAIVVDAPALSGAGPRAAAALAGFAAGGGTLVYWAPDAAAAPPIEPFGTLLAPVLPSSAPCVVVRHGLGVVVMLRADVAAAHAVLANLWAPLHDPERLRSGGGSDGHYFRAKVRGFGPPPPEGLLMLVLVYVVGAGALAFASRRRAALVRLGATGALGIALAAAVFIWGAVREGFGVHGTIRSVTVLDQRAQTAVTAAHRGLYAGGEPEFRIRPETWIASEDVHRDGDGRSRLVLDLDDGSVGGGL